MNQINNSEFLEAWNNTDNAKIINQAVKKYAKFIPYDELTSCKLIALWQAISKHDETKGRNFTSYLYMQVEFECLKYIQKNAKWYKRHKSLDKILIQDDSGVNINDILVILDGIPLEYKEILIDRFYKKMTLKEIGNQRGYSYENARKKIIKAIELINEKRTSNSKKQHK